MNRGKWSITEFRGGNAFGEWYVYKFFTELELSHNSVIVCVEQGIGILLF